MIEGFCHNPCHTDNFWVCQQRMILVWLDDVSRPVVILTEDETDCRSPNVIKLKENRSLLRDPEAISVMSQDMLNTNAVDIYIL